MNFLHRKTSDLAFMGVTHAVSGLALFLSLVAFVPSFVTWAGWTTPGIIALAGLVFSGAALVSDLDNSVSTAKNSLGLLGEVLSVFFRATSRFMQTTVRTRRDDASPDPHRGFWHTIPAALLLGFLTWIVTSITAVVTLPFVGAVTIGWISALVITYLSIHLSFAGIFSKLIKKVLRKSHLSFAGIFSKLIKKVLKGSASFEAVAVAVALIGTIALFWTIPHNQSFWWLSVAVAGGVITHILGDAFTTAGVPLLFPLSAFLKGKFWWNTRFLPIKAGGTIENYVFLPLFSLISLAAFVWIFVGPALHK